MRWSFFLEIVFKPAKKSNSLHWLKEHCHAIWQLYKKPEGVFTSTEFQNYRSSVVIRDYFNELKLLPVACRYGWHGWKWIEI